MLTFQFALTENDCAAYFEATMLENLNHGWKKPLLKFVVTWFFLILGIIYLDNMDGKFPSFAFMALSAITVVNIFLKLPQKKSLNIIYERTLVAQFHSFVANPDNEPFFDKKTYHITDKGIDSLSERGELSFFWNAFVKRKDTATHIFLFLGQSSALVFPKNKIASLAEFEAMLARHISFHAEVGRQIK